MSLAALQDRVAGLKAKAADQAQANRAKAPEFAAFVDDLRAHFGDGVKVRYVDFGDGTRVGAPTLKAGEVAVPISTPPQPQARAADPATSKAAAVAARGLAADHHARILAALVRPMTCYEIGAAVGMDHVAVARRMSELRQAGAVRDSGKARAGPSGRDCTVWARE